MLRWDSLKNKMKQTINICAFFIVLAIPFALSSQTRKAIPAGRYEALSGVKNSRTAKSTDATSENSSKEAMSLFWSEVVSHFPEKESKISFFVSGKMEDFEMSYLTAKGYKSNSNLSDKTKLIFSDDLKRDKETLKSIQGKDKLIVLKDNRELKDVMFALQKFEVILYQAENKTNYFLLKQKNN
jgi:hypothetical protein